MERRADEFTEVRVVLRTVVQTLGEWVASSVLGEPMRTEADPELLLLFVSRPADVNQLPERRVVTEWRLRDHDRRIVLTVQQNNVPNRCSCSMRRSNQLTGDPGDGCRRQPRQGGGKGLGRQTIVGATFHPLPLAQQERFSRFEWFLAPQPATLIDESAPTAGFTVLFQT